MSHKVSLVRVVTSATGNSTPITLGAAYSQLFMTPAEAGAMDGRVYTYLIVDGNNFEVGRGVYTASGTTLARSTILYSRISGTLGTTRLSLSGTAQVRFVEAAEDMDGVRGTRAVTGTTDTINNSDLGYVVTYSNASAIAVSLAQAGTSNLFLDGWACFVKNKGVGTVTITPATSTIEGASTLQLLTNQSAFIWSDGTNYQAIKFRNDLGGAAVLNVGTTAGTVAAGDDARIVAAFQVGNALGSAQVATQANQESASSVTLAVTPGRQQYHPSAAKAWLQANFSGSALTGYNISSVTDVGTGAVQPNWATAFSSSNYAVIATVGATPLGSGASTFTTTVANTLNAGYAQIYTVRMSDFGGSDASFLSAAAFGDQ